MEQEYWVKILEITPAEISRLEVLSEGMHTRFLIDDTYFTRVDRDLVAEGSQDRLRWIQNHSGNESLQYTVKGPPSKTGVRFTSGQILSVEQIEHFFHAHRADGFVPHRRRQKTRRKFIIGVRCDIVIVQVDKYPNAPVYAEVTSYNKALVDGFVRQFAVPADRLTQKTASKVLQIYGITDLVTLFPDAEKLGFRFPAQFEFWDELCQLPKEE